MKNLKGKMALMALIGALCGISISVIIGYFGADESEVVRGNIGLVFQYVGSAIYGAVCMGGSVVYDMEKWGVVKCTIIHYLLVMISLLTVNACLDWFPRSVFGFVVIGFTLAYFIIWIILYFGWRREIRRMNEELKERGYADEKKD